MLEAAALIVACAVLLSPLVWLLDRRDQRHAQDREAFIAAGAEDQRALLAAVADLCQRIQAPETAVAQHVAETNTLTGPLYVPVDDDMMFERDRSGALDG